MTFKLTKHLAVLASCATIALAGMSTTASAETKLRGSSAYGPAHIQATVFATFIDKFEELTDGRYTGQDFTSGLINAAEMVTGLRDGVVDFGSMLMIYFPADFPESMVPSELSIIGDNPVAIANATTEYIMSCAECQAEYTERGQIYMGSGWTSPYQIQAKKPVIALEDLKGLRLRTAGSVFTSWAEFMGAEPVQIPATETFEALNQGIIDAFFANLPELEGQQLQDVITDVTLIKFGLFNADNIGFSAEVWNDLTEEDREAFLRASMYAREAGAAEWVRKDNEAYELMEKHNITVHEPSEEMVARIDAFRTQHLEGLVETLEGRGVENAQAKIDRYLALLEKWENLLADKELSADEMVELKMSEIWSQVDLASYGE